MFSFISEREDRNNFLWTTPGVYYWEKPAECTGIYMLAVGAGGGGGGGVWSSVIQGKAGGGGGASGGIMTTILPSWLVPSSLIIQVGNGGSGGAGGSGGTGASGATGNAGENSLVYFSHSLGAAYYFVKGPGGNPGTGGVTITGGTGGAATAVNTSGPNTGILSTTMGQFYPGQAGATGGYSNNSLSIFGDITPTSPFPGGPGGGAVNTLTNGAIYPDDFPGGIVRNVGYYPEIQVSTYETSAGLTFFNPLFSFPGSGGTGYAGYQPGVSISNGAISSTGCGGPGGGGSSNSPAGNGSKGGDGMVFIGCW